MDGWVYKYARFVELMRVLRIGEISFRRPNSLFDLQKHKKLAEVFQSRDEQSQKMKAWYLSI